MTQTHAHDELVPLKHFDWSEIMDAYPSTPGNQVLHFNGRNKPYTDDPNATVFVTKYFKNAKALEADAEVLRFACDAVTLKEGFYLEMGVATGKTINFIAALNPTKKIYGFDSFAGLPKYWNKGNKILKEGTFAFKRQDIKLPVINNVVIYKGLFDEVLPRFKKKILKESPVALLHIDSDIYESAKDVFTALETNIVSGTIIVFDEFYNYPSFEQHEWKAFQEFVQKRQLKYTFIAYNKLHEQAVIRIL